MFALVLLVLPLSHSAPPLRSHAPPPPCDTTICRVSDQSLDSALTTFLCFTEKQYSAMEEIDKKRELAAAIAPYLDGFLEEELVAMDSESLVSLVNLVLYAGSDKVVKKTKQQHFADLISSVASTGFVLTPDFFRKVDPILLGLINCQSKIIAEIDELVAPMAGEERAGRTTDLFNTLQDQIVQVFKNLPSLPGESDLPALSEETTSPEAITSNAKKLQDQIMNVFKNLPSLPQESDLPAMPEVSTSPEAITSNANKLLQEMLGKLMKIKGVTTAAPMIVEPSVATTTVDYSKDFLGFVSEILSEVPGMPDIDIKAMSEAGKRSDKDAINKMLDDAMAVAIPE